MEAEADLARCGALKHFWYVACLSTELTKAQPLARTIFGTHVVLFRDHHGQAVALYDRCLHRHARLSAGRVCNGRLGCPYHGWVYDGTGRCVEIPSLGPTQHGQGLSAEARVCAGLKRTPSEVGQVKRFATLDDGVLAAAFKQILKGTPRPPVVTKADLENAETYNVDAGLLKAEEKLKSYDGLFTDEYVR